MEARVTEEALWTPSERLARRVVARLIKENLLSKEQAGKLLPRLIDGTVTGEDWRLAVDMSAEDKASDHA